MTSRTPSDPRGAQPQPAYDTAMQSPPGSTEAMSPRPDHGEKSYQGTGKLTNRSVLITGGDSGIGRAVAIAFAREGADVAITHLPQERQDAEETGKLVKDAGVRAVLIETDLTEEENCRAVIDRVIDEFERIDILVNNAAYQMSVDGIEKLTDEQLDRVMKTNVYAMVWLCRAAVRHMPQGSSIINTSSIQAYEPSPNLLDYAMTKAAIANFTKSLSLDLIQRGIRVNSVAPGPVWTPLIPATNTPMGRPAQPAELAPIYGFLASEESRYITGDVLGVTGGRPIS